MQKKPLIERETAWVFKIITKKKHIGTAMEKKGGLEVERSEKDGFKSRSQSYKSLCRAYKHLDIDLEFVEKRVYIIRDDTPSRSNSSRTPIERGSRLGSCLGLR